MGWELDGMLREMATAGRRCGPASTLASVGAGQQATRPSRLVCRSFFVLVKYRDRWPAPTRLQNPCRGSRRDTLVSKTRNFSQGGPGPRRLWKTRTLGHFVDLTTSQGGRLRGKLMSLCA